eukprot:1173925-Prorocentrum_minimum.AAC.8
MLRAQRTVCVVGTFFSVRAKKLGGDAFVEFFGGKSAFRGPTCSARASKSSGESWRQAAKAQARLANACARKRGRLAMTYGTSASNSSASWCSSRACALR